MLKKSTYIKLSLYIIYIVLNYIHRSIKQVVIENTHIWVK